MPLVLSLWTQFWFVICFQIFELFHVYKQFVSHFMLYSCPIFWWRDTNVGKAIPVQAWGFKEIRVPSFQDCRCRKVVRLSVLRTGRLYPPGYIGAAHLCDTLNRCQRRSAAGRIMSKKNSNDTIGNRTSDIVSTNCDTACPKSSLLSVAFKPSRCT